MVMPMKILVYISETDEFTKPGEIKNKSSKKKKASKTSTLAREKTHSVLS